MVPDDGVEYQQPLKRSRTTTACQNCRDKKLSCSGGRPCTRCRQDDRRCNDVVVSERTPLTRKRMTDLEERLGDYERIWTALFPHLSLDTIRDWLSNNGIDATIQEIKQTINHSTSSDATQSTRSRPQSIAAERQSEPLVSPLSSRTVADDHELSAIDPFVRPASPPTPSVRISLSLHDAPHGASNAWNEDSTPRDGLSGASVAEKDTTGATPGNDFGTGVRSGAGYIGLSSAATLLRAIHKFAPEEAPAPDHGSREGPVSSTSLTSTNLAKLSRTSILQGDDSCDSPKIPPYSEIGPFVDSYFKYFHALTPIVHEPTIRAQITGALPLPTGCGSRILFNMIFATGAFDAALDDDLDTMGVKYYEEARAALQQDLLEGGSLMLVQGLAIMAIWLQRSNKPNAGYVCLGLAIRMATALGAHVTPSHSHDNGVSVLEAELRSRIWWCLVTLESGQCMTYGRPYGISLPSLSAVRFPVNTDDGGLTVSTIRVPADVQHVTLYTALITQARLAQIAFHSLDQVSRVLPHPTAEQIKRCGDEFRDQLAAMPAHMQPDASGPYRLARRVQVWRTRDYRSILYRPVLLSAAWDTNGVAASDKTVQEIIHICRALALDNLSDITQFVQTDPDPHRGCEWYLLYFGIQASLTILLSIVWEPHHPAATLWRSSIQETITWLRELKSVKQLGVSYANIMENALVIQPDIQENIAIEAVAPTVQYSDQYPPADNEGFDFERYFSEIWDGQAQFAGVAGDVNLGMMPDEWEDIATGIGGGAGGGLGGY